MSVRDELLSAIESGDHQAVHRRGWGDVWEHLATANAPRQTCSLTELKPYAKLLGNEPVAAILDALDACAGEFRPTAGEVRGHLNRQRGENHRVDVGRGRDRSSTAEALSAVADAIRAGEEPCSCGPPTLRRWRPDADHVLRCPVGHVEQGQVFAAEDAGLLEVESA